MGAWEPIDRTTARGKNERTVLETSALSLSLCLMVCCASGCGTSPQNVLLSHITTADQNQVKEVVLKETKFKVYLPTSLPFTPTNGMASATIPVFHGRGFSQQFTIKFYDKSELITLTEPEQENLDPRNIPGSIHLSNGSPAVFQTSKKWSELSWQDPNGFFTLYSSKISGGNYHSLEGPDLNQQQLLKIADSVKDN